MSVREILVTLGLLVTVTVLSTVLDYYKEKESKNK
jgi:hypothetical protein